MNPCRFMLTAPSTTANLGPGFDCLGLALDQRNRWDFSVVAGDVPGRCRVLESVGGGAKEDIPMGADHLFFSSWSDLHRMGLGPNLVDMLKDRGLEAELRSFNATPIARGLGSSAAVRVASAEAYLRLTGIKREAWELAAQLEGHPDNAAPAGLGGLVAGTRDLDGQFQVIQFPLHECWKIVLAVPQFALHTVEARAVLPVQIPRADAIFNMGRLLFLLEGLKVGCSDLVRLGCQDRWHQSQRASLIPGMQSVMEAAVKAGAAAAYLSGAGPTVAAFVDTRLDNLAPAVEHAMAAAFRSAGVEVEIDTLAVDNQGLEFLEVCPLG